MKPVCLLLGFLGLLAVPDAEGAAFPIANFNCRQGGDACVSGGTIEQLPAVNGLAGIKMFANAPMTFGTTCEEECWEELSLVELNVIGPMSGTWAAGQTIPISWDFTLQFNGPVSLRRWEFNAGISANLQSTIVSVNGTNTGQISGSGTLTSFGIPDGQPMILYSQILVYWTGQPASTLTVTVPGNSIDFGVAPTAGVPEPGTAGLVLGGLLVAGWMRRSR